MRLLSTDFDGTLIGHGSDGLCVPSFATALSIHHEKGGLWAVNTGRSLEHALEGLAIFGGPVEPDFFLTNERHIFRREGEAWIDHGPWNEDCRARHEDLFLNAGEVFRQIEDMARRQPEKVTVVYEAGVPAGIVTADEETMEVAAGEIDRASVGVADFAYQRNTIYLRFCHRDYHKGSALGELCRLEGIATSDVFAVGDHLNDLPMLDVSYAGMVACPANAIEPVKRVIEKFGGYVAENPWADGVAEAMAYYWKKSEGLRT